MNTLQEVEQYAASQGIVITQTERDEIARMMVAERNRLMQTRPVNNSFADRFNSFYPRLLAFLAQAGDTVLTFTQAVIVSLGIPAVLVLLLVVEHQRVLHGIALFEVEYSLANFAAFALVMLNLVLEFQVHYIEHQAGYTERAGMVWSARLWLANMAYRLGLGSEWIAREQSPAQRYKKLLSLVTFSILTLALVGSMRGVIEQQSGAWHTALIQIATDSTLLEMMTWLGGLLFAAAAVLSAQGLSRYVALRCVEILSQMPTRTNSDIYAQDVERAGATIALAMIRAKQQKRDAKKESNAPKALNPFGFKAHEQADPRRTTMNAHESVNGGDATEVSQD